MILAFVCVVLLGSFLMTMTVTNFFTMFDIYSIEYVCIFCVDNVKGKIIRGL